ncbi:hypothetical protein H112_03205 [Trichophyton rubrum D6]|nr:uncharacterized protein TERG_05817 [Trichophyton rubrum CBS 118892]EZF24343.1 hypothetical protein H100_03209 [Trichophyton rubrum MR850]EZF43304.1 hypothetical protein H102_03203 [Trichophyton rubrum CBS 100081]EZF53946.1 hypothetical protein H103_03217 [Trichophyton rubrum CBS 288.86]EZF64594.1 hypothetical protein H104_03199 [Trichophyton rubrum CBS 289.86]EZF75176.1 hypothetical protein H105_03221 [Trichophyton soudanense CBS 452.61]EZF85873.1 hypothetical protein H110_03210 [Trichophy
MRPGLRSRAGDPPVETRVSEAEAPAETGEGSASVVQEPAACYSPDDAPCTPRKSRTPRRSRKRVRFSDPGCHVDQENTPEQSDPSTGLTPLVSRTTLLAGQTGDTAVHTSRSGGKRRDSRLRHSDPAIYSQLRQTQAEMAMSTPDSNIFRYLRFHDILDPRSRRRIQRLGFSEAMNEIDRRRKEEKRLQRQKDEQMRQLQMEVESLRNQRMEIDCQHPTTEESVCKTPERSERQSSNPMEESLLTPCPNTSGDSAAIMDDDMMDEDFSAPNSPLWTPMASSTPISTFGRAISSTTLSDPNTLAQIEQLTGELNDKNRDQLYLFEEWQRISGQPNAVTPNATTQDNEYGEEHSALPPPDLAKQVIATLQDATVRAAEAVQKVKDLQSELSGHGFDGESAAEIISSIEAHFRHARVELERLVPGETANASLSNWKAIIDALVDRIHRLVRGLKQAKDQIKSGEDRERALRKQFDATLFRLEQETKEKNKLGKYAESIAEDTLNMRMKLQSMERDMKEQETDKIRLQDALSKYREDLLMLERLNSELEDEVAASEKKAEKLTILNNRMRDAGNLSKARIFELEGRLKREKETTASIEASLHQSDLKVLELNKKIKLLETKKEEVITALEKAAKEQSIEHQKEVGNLNLRLSAISTSLNETKAENATLQSEKAQLEKRQRNMERISWNAIRQTQQKQREAMKAIVEWQNGIQLLAKDAGRPSTCSDAMAGLRHSFNGFGSEPITPETVSRFKNVDIGKGKKRRRCPDSGVNMVVEEDVWSESEALASSACKPTTAFSIISPISPRA